MKNEPAMKAHLKFAGALLLLSTLNARLPTAFAASTIDPINKYAYGANLGWMDWTGDTANGAVIGDYVCLGNLYAANVGWINLGSGSPTNGIRYQNLEASDFGVNHDGLGNLRGYAWGANIGWLNFESNGAPRVDLRTGKMSGYVYSANCGWIGLSNAAAYVQTDTINQGRLDTNGLPIAWELLNFGHLGVDPNDDPDSDGMSNAQEYLAGTNPNDPNSDLEIISLSATPGGANATVTWESVLTRNYYLQKRLSLNPNSIWFDSGLGLISPDGPVTMVTIADTNASSRFYRVRAVRPLAP
jgi:hypothetical protein